MTTGTSAVIHHGGALKGIALAVMLICAAGHGQAAESARLTQASVQRFIASYPDVKSLTVAKAASKGTKISGSDNPLLVIIEAASDDSLRTEMDATARRHGFRDGKEWFGVARSVGFAYAHLKHKGVSDPKTQAKLEKAIAKIEDMPLLSEKQKNKLIAELRKGSQAVSEPPPPENVAVVKALTPQIESLVK